MPGNYKFAYFNLRFANQMKSNFLQWKWLLAAGICVITFVCFRYTLNNQFTNWDDDFYVTNDPYIKSFTPENLRVIFTEDITKNNYHPLCMLSLAINYHFSKLDPWAYYLTNVLIHIANVLLVFLFVIQLCRRLNMEERAQLFIASFSALWFGIHPMHVESVGWIAERKDVLYAFFYFLGLLAYLKYISTRSEAWYIGAFLLFVASCLSKPMGVVFPFSMVCIDFLLRREGIKKLALEKILFVAASLFFGWYAFYEQNKTGAVAKFETLSIAERLMYASYGFVMYIQKLFNPSYLSTFYPYPFRYTTGYLHPIFYAAPFLSIAIVMVPVYLAYRSRKMPDYFRVAVFGMGFFVANIMFVLQFISVGAAIMADRYSYVAYFGLFFLLAYFFNELARKYPSLKTGILVVLLVASAGLAYGCYERTFVWHDAETLLSDAIEKYPLKKDLDGPHDAWNSGVAQLSYKWRGNYYVDKGEYDKALEDYNVLVTLRGADAKVWDKVGIIYEQKKDYKSAMEAFSQSLQVQNNAYKTYLDRSMLYIILGDTDKALQDFVVAYKLNPKSEALLSDSSFSYVHSGKDAWAVQQYDMLLLLNPINPFYYFYRGVGEFNLQKIQPALRDWEIAVRFNSSKDVKQSASYNLSVAFDALDRDSLAVYYAEMALGAGYAVKPEFLASLREKKKKQAAGKR